MNDYDADDDYDTDDEYDTLDEDFDDDDYGAEESETEACPHCGRPIYEDAPQCPYCGMYVSREEYNPWANRRWWWIALGLLGTVAVIVSLIVVFRAV